MFGDLKFGGLLSARTYGLDVASLSRGTTDQLRTAAAAPAPGDGVIPPAPPVRRSLEELREQERLDFEENRMRCELMIARDAAERHARRISTAQGDLQALRNEVDERRDAFKDTAVDIAEDLPVDILPHAPYIKVKWGKAARQAYRMHEATEHLDAANAALHRRNVQNNTDELELSVRLAEITRLTNQINARTTSTS